MPAAELVDKVEVVRRDDQTVKLSQVTPVWIRQTVHAVVVHCGLTPHTPEGGPEGHSPVSKVRNHAKKLFLPTGASPRFFPSPKGAGLPLTLTCEAIFTSIE